MSLKDLLADLQKDYIKSMPGKIVNLQLLWNERKHDELVTEYHKLKGTGRTYGISEVSQLGEALETICESSAAETTLQTAVQLSLRILEQIHQSRADGHAYNLDDDRDFRVIVELVFQLNASKGTR